MISTKSKSTSQGDDCLEDMTPSLFLISDILFIFINFLDSATILRLISLYPSISSQVSRYSLLHSLSWRDINQRKQIFVDILYNNRDITNDCDTKDQIENDSKSAQLKLDYTLSNINSNNDSRPKQKYPYFAYSIELETLIKQINEIKHATKIQTAFDINYQNSIENEKLLMSKYILSCNVAFTSLSCVPQFHKFLTIRHALNLNPNMKDDHDNDINSDLTHVTNSNSNSNSNNSNSNLISHAHSDWINIGKFDTFQSFCNYLQQVIEIGETNDVYGINSIKLNWKKTDDDYFSMFESMWINNNKISMKQLQKDPFRYNFNWNSTKVSVYFNVESWRCYGFQSCIRDFNRLSGLKLNLFGNSNAKRNKKKNKNTNKVIDNSKTRFIKAIDQLFLPKLTKFNDKYGLFVNHCKMTVMHRYSSQKSVVNVTNIVKILENDILVVSYKSGFIR